MGTRATIKVEGIYFAKVYKHYDGYELSTLPWLEDFNRTFTNERGIDPLYKIAQLLRSSWRDAEHYGLDMSTSTGWGLIEFNCNMGEEYEYTLMDNGTVDTRRVPIEF